MKRTQLAIYCLIVIFACLCYLILVNADIRNGTESDARRIEAEGQRSLAQDYARLRAVKHPSTDTAPRRSLVGARPVGELLRFVGVYGE